MADAIPDLWPNDINVNVLTPLAILRYQAGQLGQKTKGILQAEVVTVSTKTSGNAANSGSEEMLRFHLELIAPVLNGYRYRVLTAEHPVRRVYPVTIQAAALAIDERDDDGTRYAATQADLMALIRDILGSSEMKSVMQSLIAQSNDQGTVDGNKRADVSERPTAAPERKTLKPAVK